MKTVGSFRFEDENEDEDEDEAPGFRHKEIFKLFRLQQGRDNVVAINFVVPAKLKTEKFEDFVVVKTESFVLVLDFVLVLESKALYCKTEKTKFYSSTVVYFTLEGLLESNKVQEAKFTDCHWCISIHFASVCFDEK